MLLQQREWTETPCLRPRSLFQSPDDMVSIAVSIYFLSPAQPLVFLSASPKCAPWERKPQAPSEQGKGNVQNLVPEYLET